MVAYIWWNHFQIIVSIYVQCLASCTQPPIKQAASRKHKQAFKAMKCEKSTSKHTYILLKLGKGIQKHNYSYYFNTSENDKNGREKSEAVGCPPVMLL